MELDVRRCDYCGSPLNPRIYFCGNCSQPYTEVEFVLPKVAAPYLSENLEVGENGISWNQLLVLSNLKRGFIPVLMHGTDAGVVREGKIPITSLGLLEEVPAFITLPRSTRVTRIELAR